MSSLPSHLEPGLPGPASKLPFIGIEPEYVEEQVKCQAACPAHTDARRYIWLIAEGRFDEAYALNKIYNVFPAVLGRVCTRPCEDACRRSDDDDPVSIRALKRAAADFRSERWRHMMPERHPPNGMSVAIIGSGPAGLSAAQDLALLGYEVVVYEAMSVPGGMLVAGIPAYRLPREIVEEEIRDLYDYGVEIRCGIKIGTDIQVSDLLARHDAVLIAAGCQKPVRLKIPGEDSQGVWPGLWFMEKVNLGDSAPEEARAHGGSLDLAGKRVAVIGGGFTAVDCVRSAVRLGASEVKMVYRRGMDEMPSSPEEIHEAQQEGVELILLASPVEIVADTSGSVSVLRCVRNRLGEPDASGRRRPVTIEGSEFDIETDIVIAAVSQDPDLSWIDVDLEVTRWGTVRIHQGTGMTSVAGLFAAGDIALGAANVIEAVADAHKAAEGIHRYLGGSDSPAKSLEAKALPGYARDMVDYERPREEQPVIALAERESFEAEVELGYSKSTAIEQARRCYFCQIQVSQTENPCVLCGACVEVCPKDTIDLIRPDGTIIRPEDLMLPRAGQPGDQQLPAIAPSERASIVIDDDGCIRCGLCAAYCPTKTLVLKEYIVHPQPNLELKVV
jgi:NADPH-dependent glutamate synthase beta subunit-like oxidoreductase